MKGSTSLITKKKQTKTRMPHHLTPVKMVFIRKTRINKKREKSREDAAFVQC